MGWCAPVWQSEEACDGRISGLGRKDVVGKGGCSKKCALGEGAEPGSVAGFLEVGIDRGWGKISWG